MFGHIHVFNSCTEYGIILSDMRLCIDNDVSMVIIAAFKNM